MKAPTTAPPSCTLLRSIATATATATTTTTTTNTSTKLPRHRIAITSAITRFSFIILLSLSLENARSRTSAMPRGFLESGRPIACERGQPVKITDYFPDLSNPCIYCFCPESGSIQCELKTKCEITSSRVSPTSTVISNELPHRHSQSVAPAPPPQPSRNRDVAPPPPPARKMKSTSRTTKTTHTHHTEPNSPSSHVAFARMGPTSFDLIPRRKIGDDDLKTAAAALRIDRNKFDEKRNSYLRELNDRTSTTAATTTTTTPEPTTTSTELEINTTDETLEPIEPEQALDDLSSSTTSTTTIAAASSSSTTHPPTFTNNDINLATGYVDLDPPETELVARLNDIQQQVDNNNGSQLEVEGSINDTMFYVALGLELFVLTTILVLASCFSYRDFCQERKYDEQREEYKKQQQPPMPIIQPPQHILVSNSNSYLPITSRSR